MMWYLLIGTALMGWTMLLLVAGERQRRLNDMETKFRQLAADRAQVAPAEIPTIG